MERTTIESVEVLDGAETLVAGDRFRRAGQSRSVYRIVRIYEQDGSVMLDTIGRRTVKWPWANHVLTPSDVAKVFRGRELRKVLAAEHVDVDDDV